MKVERWEQTVAASEFLSFGCQKPQKTSHTSLHHRSSIRAGAKIETDSSSPATPWEKAAFEVRLHLRTHVPGT